MIALISHQISNSLGNYNYNAYLYHNTQFAPHFHGNFELIYVFSGTSEITVNSVEETLADGELILIPPYSVHSLSVGEGKIWVGVFSPDFVCAYSEKYMYVKYSKFKCDPQIEKFLKEQLFFQGCPAHFLQISCLYMVCNECVKHAEIIQGEQYGIFIHDTVSYISENLTRDICLKELAAALNYEYHYFSSLFHQSFGIHFKSFVNYYRFDKACSLLSNKENSITDIAQRCGFGSIRNFNRVFKKLSGYTPGEYRSKATSFSRESF